MARVKIMAGLNIAEKRLPQDGRIRRKIAGKDDRHARLDRSRRPTASGSSCVCSTSSTVLLDLADIGFGRTHARQIMESSSVGRTASSWSPGRPARGKTTTLYACLDEINTPDKNILTVEDPVEYQLEGIGQMQVNSEDRPDLRRRACASFLRQDPDVIMVGEIRDQETAEIAIHASLTGHLVFSTLHTNDAPSAVTRLVDMGVQPFLISSSVLAVLAQRLVRKLCPFCRRPYHPSDEDLRSLGLDANRFEQQVRELSRVAVAGPLGVREEAVLDMGDLVLEEEPTRVAVAADTDPLVRLHAPGGKPVFFRADGCEECSQTGYRGRIGIFEFMVVDEPIRREILNNTDSNTIGRVAQQRGMQSLRQDGARQVVAGVTSVEEVLAATQAGELE